MYAKVVSLLILSLVLAACASDTLDQPKIPSTSTLIDFLNTELSASDSTVYDDVAQEFIIDNDIVVGLDTAKRYFSQAKRLSVQQRWTSKTVSASRAKDIKVYIWSNVPNRWQVAAVRSMNAYNKAGVDAKFRRVYDTGSADIRVAVGDLPENVGARALFPSGGAPGTRVYTNPKGFAKSYSEPALMRIMMHEFGHTLGMAHNEAANNRLIPGTSSADTNSIFNASLTAAQTQSKDFPSFSEGDIKALRYIY